MCEYMSDNTTKEVLIVLNMHLGSIAAKLGTDDDGVGKFWLYVLPLQDTWENYETFFSNMTTYIFSIPSHASYAELDTKITFHVSAHQLCYIDPSYRTLRMLKTPISYIRSLLIRSEDTVMVLYIAHAYSMSPQGDDIVKYGPLKDVVMRVETTVPVVRSSSEPIEESTQLGRFKTVTTVESIDWDRFKTEAAGVLKISQNSRDSVGRGRLENLDYIHFLDGGVCSIKLSTGLYMNQKHFILNFNVQPRD